MIEWKQLLDTNRMNLDQFINGKIPDHMRKMYTAHQKDFELRH